MPIYLTPDLGDHKELSDLTSKSGLYFSHPETVRQLLIEINDHAHAVFAVKPDILLILTRHAAHLLDEVPSVILSIPGLVYSAEWSIAATAFHGLDYVELRDKLAKSGVLAHSVVDLEKRDMGSLFSDANIIDAERTSVDSAPTDPLTLTDYRQRRKDQLTSISETEDRADDDEDSVTNAEELL